MGTVVSQWGQHGPRPQPTEATRRYFQDLELIESAEMACGAEEAWALVADVARMCEFSPECVAVRWLDGVDEVVVGSRFEGVNRVVSGADEFIWIRLCTVTHCDRGRLFGYVVGDRYDGSPASWWRFDVTRKGKAHCLVTQTFRHDPDGLSGLRTSVDAEPTSAQRLIDERLAGLALGMRGTLHRMRSVLQGSDGRAGSQG